MMMEMVFLITTLSDLSVLSKKKKNKPGGETLAGIAFPLSSSCLSVQSLAILRGFSLVLGCFAFETTSRVEPGLIYGAPLFISSPNTVRLDS